MKPVLPASILTLQVGTVGPEECHAWSTEAAKKKIPWLVLNWKSYKSCVVTEEERENILQLHYTKSVLIEWNYIFSSKCVFIHFEYSLIALTITCMLFFYIVTC